MSKKPALAGIEVTRDGGGTVTTSYDVETSGVLPGLTREQTTLVAKTLFLKACFIIIQGEQTKEVQERTWAKRRPYIETMEAMFEVTPFTVALLDPREDSREA